MKCEILLNMSNINFQISESHQKYILPSLNTFQAKIPFNSIILSENYNNPNSQVLQNNMSVRMKTYHHQFEERQSATKDKDLTDKDNLLFQYENQQNDNKKPLLSKSTTSSLLTTAIEDNDVLFILTLEMGETYPIKARNINCFNEFCYRLGIISTCEKDQVNCLKEKGEWSLCEEGIVCKINYAHKTEDVKYYPIGLFNALPKEVLKKCRDKQYIPEIVPFEQEKTEITRSIDSKSLLTFYQQTYGGDGLLPLYFSSIPVLLHSVKRNHVKAVEKINIDILHFRNLQNFFDYTNLLFGPERMLRSTLDLFDAMAIHRVNWKIDPAKQIIYLPCLPSYHNAKSLEHEVIQIPSTVQLTNSHGQKIETIAHLFHVCKDSVFKSKLVRTIFPMLQQMSGISFESVEKEVLRRLSVHGEYDTIGKIHKILQEHFCVLPKCMM